MRSTGVVTGARGDGSSATSVGVASGGTTGAAGAPSGAGASPVAAAVSSGAGTAEAAADEVPGSTASSAWAVPSHSSSTKTARAKAKPTARSRRGIEPSAGVGDSELGFTGFQCSAMAGHSPPCDTSTPLPRSWSYQAEYAQIVSADFCFFRPEDRQTGPLPQASPCLRRRRPPRTRRIPCAPAPRPARGRLCRRSGRPRAHAPRRA